MHRRLSDLFGRSDWWDAPSLRLHNVARRIAADALDEVVRRRRIPTPDRVVAELPFGFWVSLLGSGSDYETRLWRPALHHAFPGTKVVGSHYTTISMSHAGSGTGSRITNPSMAATLRRTMLGSRRLSL